MKYAREARKGYQNELQKKRQEQTASERKRHEKRKLNSELKKAKDEKKKFEEERKIKAAKLDSEIFNIEEQLRKS